MKKHFVAFLFVFLSFSLPLVAQEMDAFWTLVFAGDNITTPVFANGNIYTAGKDRAINCITNKGTFLWRRNTEGYPTPLISTSSDAIVYLITRGGNIEAYSSQGIPIWTYKCGKMPLFPVYIANEGYLIVTFENKLLTLTRQGKIKWELDLPSKPIKEPIEIAQKNLILLLEDGSFLRISMFGKILEQLVLKKNITVVSFAPQGYCISCNDNTISYYKVGETSTLIWQKAESVPCVGITFKDGFFLCVYSDGRIESKKASDGDAVWQQKLDSHITGNVKCSFLGSEFNIRDKGFAAVLLQKGKIKWQKTLQEKEFLPIITDNGLLIGIKREILNAYRMETKLLSKNKKIEEKSVYTNEKDREEAKKDLILNRTTVLYLLGFSTFDFFKDVEKDIKSGAVGQKEDYYAIMLSGIVRNDAKHAYFSHEFSSFERRQAAALLGQMGLYEYREVLLSQININIDEELALGILSGLASLAYDPDGKTIESIKFILNRFSHTNIDVLKAVADAFFTLAKFGDEQTAKRAIESSFSIMNGPYPAVIKEYVRQKLKNII